jgi:NitT/TauT family transport system substrate-binding protein
VDLSPKAGVTTTSIAIVVAAVVVIGGVAIYFAQASPATNKVTLMLNFAAEPYHAFAYYGLSQGIYKNSGFDLSIQPGQNDGAAIAAVSAGQVQFGLTDTSNLIDAEATANITNVRIVAMILRSNIFAVIYNSAEIHSVADLAGKTAGASSPTNGGISTALFSIMAEENNVSLSSIHFVYASAPVHNSLLVTGKVQFVVAAVHNLPALQAAAASNGIHLGEFDFANYGVNTYGVALITSTQMIQQHSGEVRNFVLATMQSLQDTLQSPSAAIAALVASQPQLNYNQTLAGFRLDQGCCFVKVGGVSNPLQLGWVNASRMQQTMDLVTTGLNITSPINMADIYTDAYVQAPS